MPATVKVQMAANLGWIDAEMNGISDETLDIAKEGAVIEVSEKEATALCRLRCAEVVMEPKAAKAAAGK